MAAERAPELFPGDRAAQELGDRERDHVAVHEHRVQVIVAVTLELAAHVLELAQPLDVAGVHLLVLRELGLEPLPLLLVLDDIGHHTVVLGARCRGGLPPQRLHAGAAQLRREHLEGASHARVFPGRVRRTALAQLRDAPLGRLDPVVELVEAPLLRFDGSTRRGHARRIGRSELERLQAVELGRRDRPDPLGMRPEARRDLEQHPVVRARAVEADQPRDRAVEEPGERVRRVGGGAEPAPPEIHEQRVRLVRRTLPDAVVLRFRRLALGLVGDRVGALGLLELRRIRLVLGELRLHLALERVERAHRARDALALPLALGLELGEPSLERLELAAERCELVLPPLEHGAHALGHRGQALHDAAARELGEPELRETPIAADLRVARPEQRCARGLNGAVDLRDRLAQPAEAAVERSEDVAAELYVRHGATSG